MDYEVDGQTTLKGLKLLLSNIRSSAFGKNLSFAVNTEYVVNLLNCVADEVAFIPPVSGG